MPNHAHGVYIDDNYSANSNGVTASTNQWKQVLANRNSGAVSLYGQYIGGGQAHNNMPPFYITNIFKRIA